MELCPLDNRYKKETSEVRNIFSTFGYTRNRVFIELQYFIELLHFLELEKPVDSVNFKMLCYSINENKEYWAFTERNFKKIKSYEETTNHDVKAIEYFVKDIIKEQYTKYNKYIEFVHFGLTSQDVNNSAFSLMVKKGIDTVIIPTFGSLVTDLSVLCNNWMDIVIISKTHGQPAVPTTLGKEIAVFIERLQNEIDVLKNITITTKFGGAVGNMNAHYCAYPDKDWISFADNFISSLSLKRQTYTTQIEHYDSLARVFDSVRRMNIILKDFCVDIWLYISMNYLSQKIVKTETGSSTMPHKVNPINFENAEGNFGLANALFEHFSTKLPQSRLQRDLTDSTVIRNVGLAFGYTMVAVNSIMKGVKKIEPNTAVLNEELEKHYYVIVEGIQTILRKHQIPNAYEMMKELTRTNKQITKETIDIFVGNLPISEEIKREIMEVSIKNYVGFLSKID
tara:strand:- start:54 stop:1412 length:1359 start_codon:yes stop_codon:yes gene_type:complete